MTITSLATFSGGLQVTYFESVCRNPDEILVFDIMGPLIKSLREVLPIGKNGAIGKRKIVQV